MYGRPYPWGLHASASEPLTLAGVPTRADLARVRALGARMVGDRPTETWSLAVVFLFKGFVCVLAVAMPVSAEEPTKLVAAAGVLAFGCALAMWLYASKISLLGLELLTGAGVLVSSVLVAHARTHGGMMLVAFAYPWIAIYAAHFFPRRVVNALAALISVNFAAALLASGLPHAGIYWVTVTATVWSICILLGNLSENLRRQVHTDQLTGLLNREGFRAAALRERARADRTGAPLTLVAIDLDDFKRVNDQGGHAAGDRLLADVARKWRERIRPSDVLARHGGDEFMLLLASTTCEQARGVVERLSCEGDPVRWSTGAAEWQTGEELSVALARADQRLYEDKPVRPSASPTARLQTV